jgi:hypothetical protein
MDGFAFLHVLLVICITQNYVQGTETISNQCQTNKSTRNHFLIQLYKDNYR